MTSEIVFRNISQAQPGAGGESVLHPNSWGQTRGHCQQPDHIRGTCQPVRVDLTFQSYPFEFGTKATRSTASRPDVADHQMEAWAFIPLEA
jgi:hypothetical protein